MPKKYRGACAHYRTELILEAILLELDSRLAGGRVGLVSVVLAFK